MKYIHIKSITPIQISADSLLNSVNDLRKEHGEGKKAKAKVNIDEILSNLRVLENADSEHSMLSLELVYEDENGTPCSRDFPNYGLDTKSESKISKDGDLFSVSIDLTLKAGKPKWHGAEIQECASILSSKKFSLRVAYSLDRKSDSAGYSTRVLTNLEDTELSGIVGSNFEVECK
jgi:hypothetical protein